MLIPYMVEVIYGSGPARKMVVPLVLLPVLVHQATGQSQMTHDLHQIYSTEAPRLYGYLAKRTDPDSAQDIVQESFARLHARLHKTSDISNARAYLFQIARHLLYRQTDTKHLFGSDAILESLPAPETADEAEQREERELMQTLQQAVGLLSPKERELFELRWNQGLTQAEIATVFKKSERQIRRDIEKLVNRLRAAFREQGWSADGGKTV